MSKRLTEINARMAELRAQLEGTGEVDLKAIEAEIRALSEEKASIESRQALAQSIAAGDVTPAVVTPVAEQKSQDAAAEYRTLWLKTIRSGMELSDAEKRAAMTTGAASAGAAVPTETANKIIEVVTQYCPWLDKIDLYKVPGGLVIPKEGTVNDAALHTEAASITSSTDTLGKVTLGHFEITKLITISKSVEKMTIDAFEAWLVKKLAFKIAKEIGDYIIAGTGSSQPAGIESITWGAGNSVTVAVNADLDEDDILGVVALLNGGFDAGAEWYMSKKTFFSDFHPLMNTGKNNLITCENGKYRVVGYPVQFDDRITVHEAYLANMYEGMAGNMPEDITVTSQFVVRENSYDFLGSAIFDCQIKDSAAFTKIVKATS